uniref:Acylphosphatase n=2 Tax=Schistocephalus solidus TaxID=70667 RepID=A0A0V0J2C9_SCHSO
MASASACLKSFEFEVFGRVQGVFFRKYTALTARENNIVGWVKNTSTGTVVGIAEGPDAKMDLFKNWLKTTGSPKSRIQKCDIRKEHSISALSFSSFDIIR